MTFLLTLASAVLIGFLFAAIRHYWLAIVCIGFGGCMVVFSLILYRFIATFILSGHGHH